MKNEEQAIMQARVCCSHEGLFLLTGCVEALMVCDSRVRRCKMCI